MLLEVKLQVKPLSANKMFWKKGKATIKTKDYLDYQMEIKDELMGYEWPYADEQVSFHIEAGLSARQADIDNVIKPLLDTFQSIYHEFNDNKVYYVQAHKKIVPKGDEYIWVRVGRYDSSLFQTIESQDRQQVEQDSEQETSES